MGKRLQGIHGKILPTKKSLSVSASAFNIGGIMGLTERRYKKAFLLNSITDFQNIFGDNNVSSYYAWDAVKGFWDNVVGASAQLYFAGHVGYTGSAYDGVSATKTLLDQSGTPPTAGYAAISNTGSIGSFVGATVPAIATHADYALKVTVNGTLYSFHTISIASTDSWTVICSAIQTALQAACGGTPTVGISGGKIKFTSATTGALSSMKVEAGTGGTGDLIATIDAIGATYVCNLDAPVAGVAVASTLRLDSAYQNELEFSASGNRTGYTVTNGYRVTTACNGAPSTGDTFVVLDSVAGIKVGDIMLFYHAVGTVSTYKKITSIDETAKKVNFSGAFGSSAYLDNDPAYVLGFKLKTFRKSLTGVQSEVNQDLGQIWCTMEPEVADYYVNNVFAVSSYVKATDLSSPSALNLSFPVDVSTVTYLASGADGTAATTEAHWSADLPLFDGLPIRFLANPETTDVSVQKAIETYGKDLSHNRWDRVLPIYNLPENQSKAQLLVVGAGYQRSDEVLGFGGANWLGVNDPFNTSPNAPDRAVPSCGHIMGMWIRSIAVQGIHWIPANQANPIYGANSVIGDTFLNDQDRTDLCNNGINAIQNIPGQGIQLTSAYTFSTAPEFNFCNGGLMRNFFMVSFVDSLRGTLNEPNSFPRIQSSRDAMLSFYFRMWYNGSTGNVPEGETFGQSMNADGSFTKPEQHFYVQADLINNPQVNVNSGLRDLDSWFTAPAAAASINVGVGLMLLS